MNSNDYIQLLHKVLLQKATEEETACLEAWGNEKEEHQRLIEAYKNTWSLSKNYGESVSVDTTKAWQKLEQRLRTNESAVVKKSKQSIAVWLAAASLIFVTVIAWLYSMPTNTPEWLEYQASNQQVLIANLPDGSVVSLAKGSVLKYTQQVGKRLVKLEGTAFFEVSKNPSQVFEVEANNSIISVLGTSFEVLGQDDKDAVEVHVTEGKVAIKQSVSAASVQLEGGQSARYNPQRQQFETFDLPNNILAWKTQKLVFENSRLDVVIRDLNAFFEVEIGFENASIKACHFTGKFKDSSLEEILEVLCFSSNLKMEQLNNTYQLIGQGCPLSN